MLKYALQRGMVPKMGLRSDVSGSRIHSENTFGWQSMGGSQLLSGKRVFQSLLPPIKSHPPASPQLYLGLISFLCLYAAKSDCLLWGNLLHLRLFSTSSDSILQRRQTACWDRRRWSGVDPGFTLFGGMRLWGGHPQVGRGCLVGGYHDHREDGEMAEFTSTTRPIAVIQWHISLPVFLVSPDTVSFLIQTSSIGDPPSVQCCAVNFYCCRGIGGSVKN
ncbi:uncharacterized protein BT62DRAFT_445227 [Guyanagaster necrorhizus]|uniref:Uncharacterized protein n=1 Tax=Guyanagaster necrorhizus TaxID=856835 RepID=A0A9P7VKL4_9AGAR|nr:uncharacterized protein BT62DRAFT_445227 [Guyanagaster necrorhizus MCA 3950]KAG7442352.1 hypothetical protein BT62DRAFT_445227 [Guyanagaster necrorhizus MCA 3950]